ncbi:TetR/AcrR family transcriptional regulator [Actinomadura macrotermitis]|uniref:HTH-type transcriptional repressor FabR n=1 Tax=Actinomadura macrotermitis TaxID=2585200 RepID=A0A7K0C0Y2_9ACTN|nr:TetR/AcrR family transcriptional regulator [Actinomadura macrotermitis]MQY07121.1 HTH-type transcriptional repressor FabR [Actinomadura macrotermitis]
MRRVNDEESPAPGARRRNPRGEGARLRGELLEAAVRLLEAPDGAAALTLRAVAREAGVAAPSVYRHFPDRNALVEAAVAGCFARLDDLLLRAAAGAPGPEEALRACCAAYCRFGFEHPGQYRALFSADLPWDEPAPALDGRGAGVFGRLVDAVRACADAGAARPGDAFAMATNVWVALHGIVSLRTSRPRFPWPPVEELIEAALAGQVRP